MVLRLGVDLGGTKIEIIALAAGGAVLLRRRIAAPRGDYAATLAAVCGLVMQAEQELGARGSVGVGIPGSISPHGGLVRNANSTWLNGRPLLHDLCERLGREVRVANDADCFAVSEAADGAAAGCGSVFGVILGTGVGGGLVIDGRLVAGANRIAGEWGHAALPPRRRIGQAPDADTDADERPGPACWCGRHGCIETWLSGPGWLAEFRRRAGIQVGGVRANGVASGNDSAQARGSTAAQSDVASTRDIVSAMRAGNPAARAAFDRYVDRLARALALVIDIVDPEAIVLGGGLSGIDELYDAVPQAWGAEVFADRISTRLLRNRHGDSSGVRGAAWLWPSEAASR